MLRNNSLKSRLRGSSSPALVHPRVSSYPSISRFPLIANDSQRHKVGRRLNDPSCILEPQHQLAVVQH
jgi:hypothetical protein